MNLIIPYVRFCVSISILFLSVSTVAQDILNSFYQHDKSVENINELLNVLEENYQITFSYNSQVFQDYTLPNQITATNLKDLFSQLFDDQGIKYQAKSFNKILLYGQKRTDLRISGVVRDKYSNESIPGCFIYLKNLNKVIQSTEEGHFYIRAEDTDTLSFVINALAYKSKEIVVTKNELDLIVELEYKSDIDAIIISPDADSLAFESIIDSESKYNSSDFENAQSIFGQMEALEKIKQIPGVHIGNEAQNGFIVKGGSPDQNLILLDGMPVYEASHIGGVSSIFLTPAIKSVRLISTGFPSQYGGRLSSVLDVQINEGNTKEFKISSSLGVSGLTMHAEGPIQKEKTALSLSGRISWLGALATPLIKNTLDYQDPTLRFYDVYAKVHHKFSPTSRINFTFYKGNDNISLSSDRLDDSNPTMTILNNDENKLDWGNEVFSVQFTNALSDNIFLSCNLGRSTYNYRGSGKYLQESQFSTINSTREVTLQSSSMIEDWSSSLHLNIYDLPIGKLKLGAGFIAHEFNPYLYEELLIDGISDGSTTTTESPTLASEFYTYIEDEINFANAIILNIGVHSNTYNSLGFDNSRYFNIQPRFSFRYIKPDHILKLSGSRMVQNIHLLVNPGPGLPSDLWVPSSANIPPSKATEISFNYKNKKLNNLEINFTSYFKLLDNIKEYQATSDIYYALLQNEPLLFFIDKETDWRDRVIVGEGRSYGIGINLEYNKHKHNLSFSYLYSRVFHRFDDIDEGEEFPSRFDRKNNVSLNYNFKLNKQWHIILSGVFGNGYRFTLPTETLPPDGGPIRWISPSRNNSKLPDFHHVDLSIVYTKKIGKSKLDFTFGAYNIYNRYNPFYSYIAENADRSISLIQLSVFPIIPRIGVIYSN